MKIAQLLVCVMLLLQSCVTQQKCNRLFPAKTNDSTNIVYVTKTEVKDTIIRIPGQSIEVIKYLTDTVSTIDTTLKYGNTSLTLQLNKGRFKANCNTDSLLFVITKLREYINNTRTAAKTKIVEVPVTVPKYRVPKWVWYVVGLFGLQILLLIIWIYLKLRK